jgi:hypothetical protein
MWRIRARKVKARNLSLTAGMSRQSNTSGGYLYVLNNFYQPDGGLLSVDTTDQRKVISSSSVNFNGSLNYTEPVWKNAVLAVRYNLNFSQSDSRQSTFGRGDGKYQDLIDSLSNHYRNSVLNQTATINLQGTGPLLIYTIGGDIHRYANSQENVQTDSTLKYRYTTLNPRINVRYALNTEKSIAFNYSANTQQPSISQLQPVQNNNNPLYITLGNPDLRSSFSQNFGLGFNQVKPVFFNIGVNFSYTRNSISTRVYTDSLGRQISQPVNVSGSENGGLYLGMSHKFAGIELGGTARFSFGRSVNYVGNILSHNDNFNSGGGISIGKYVANRYSIRLNANANYSSTVTSVNPSFSTHYWTQNHSFELSWFPIPGLEVNTNGNYSWQQKTSKFIGNTSTFFWNAFVSKIFLQNRLTIKWQINDILGQNSGIIRSTSGNTTTQSASNVLGRYWLIGASYRFIRHGKLK